MPSSGQKKIKPSECGILAFGREVFGSERPLDDALQSKPYLAWEYGLFTGSVVRWYVEGETEYYAILSILPEPSKVGLELVNLRGNIASGRDNAALKLQDWLIEDKALRRFSMISFDFDVAANVESLCALDSSKWLEIV